ncbi:MAG: AI-2E family transporter [Nitrospiraceae bacterium]
MVTGARSVESPFSIRSLTLTGLFVLACFYTLSLGRALFFPIVLGLLLSFLLAPIIRAFKHIWIPAPVAAAVVLLALGVGLAYGVYRLSEPAAEWMGKAPQAFREIEYKLRILKKPVQEMSKATELLGEVTNLTAEKTTQPVELKGPTWSDHLFNITGEFVAGLATTVILLYFLLASGDLFLQKLVKVSPRLRDKKRVVEISHAIETQVSTYLLTVSCINVGLGLVVGLAMSVLEMPNPALWGVMAAFLTFIPYAGHFFGIVVVTLVAAWTFDDLGWILLIGGTYWSLAFIEGMVVTPMVLGRRLTFNPVVVLLSLFLWGWIWGVGGALLAVPILAVFKIFCDHTPPLAPIGELLGR